MNMARYDWGFETEPEPHLGGRRLACPRGKVIGGSSSINGMIYVRGHARDFDHWRDQGATGWSYADVLPYFERMENWHSGGHGGDPDWRGTNGPLYVTRGKRDNPLIRAFVEAGRQAGYPVTADYNGHQQEGFGPFDMTVWKGERWSAAKAYLRPAKATGKCQVMRALATRVVLEDGRAAGVEVVLNGRRAVVFASTEVILAASAINSPKILMHSGIGPGAHLQDLDIDVVADRAGVGQNLQDHLGVYVQYACKKPVSMNPKLKWWNHPITGLQWLLFRKGAAATNHFEAGGFACSNDQVKYPNLMFHFLPLAVRYDGSAPASRHGYQVHIGPMYSNSRGHVRIKSKDPRKYPAILFNYLSTPEDRQEWQEAVFIARKILNQDAFKEFSGGELSPGTNIESEKDILEWVAKDAETAIHPCGTCKLGTTEDSVVNPNSMEVHGVKSLYVVDGSVMPYVTNGNIYAPIMMLAEKAADLIRGKTPEAPVELDFYRRTTT